MSRPLPSKLGLEVWKQHVTFPLDLKEPCVAQLKKKKKTRLFAQLFGAKCACSPLNPQKSGVVWQVWSSQTTANPGSWSRACSLRRPRRRGFYRGF